MGKVVGFFSKQKHDVIIFMNTLFILISLVQEYKTLFYFVTVISVAYTFFAFTIELIVMSVYITRVETNTLDLNKYDAGVKYSKMPQLLPIIILISALTGYINELGTSAEYFFIPSIVIFFICHSFSSRNEMLKQQQRSILKRKLNLSYDNTPNRWLNNLALKWGLSNEVIIDHYKMKPINKGQLEKE